MESTGLNARFSHVVRIRECQLWRSRGWQAFVWSPIAGLIKPRFVYAEKLVRLAKGDCSCSVSFQLASTAKTDQWRLAPLVDGINKVESPKGWLRTTVWFRAAAIVELVIMARQGRNLGPEFEREVHKVMRTFWKCLIYASGVIGSIRIYICTYAPNSGWQLKLSGCQIPKRKTIPWYPRRHITNRMCGTYFLRYFETLPGLKHP